MSALPRLSFRYGTVFVFVANIFAGTAVWAQPAGDATNGKSLYEAKCGGCHSVDSNRIGPLHRGVIGRVIASVPGYQYSDAIKKLSGKWTPERLDKWLQGPQVVAPGAKMFFTVDDPGQRQDIIAYLVSLTPTGPKR
jgi:cytochrome c